MGSNIAIIIFTEILHPLFFRSESGETILPFLPLMVTSVSCAFENVVCWLLALYLMFHKCSAIDIDVYVVGSNSCLTGDCMDASTVDSSKRSRVSISTKKIN